MINNYEAMFYKKAQKTVVYVTTGTQLFVKSHGGVEFCCPVW